MKKIKILHIPQIYAFKGDKGDQGIQGIPGNPDDGFVPYTGAIDDLRMGTHYIIARKKVNIVSTGTTLDDTYEIVIVSNGSTIVLPSAVTYASKVYNIIRSGTSNVTINTTSSQTISGDSNLVLVDQWDSVVVVSDGNNWVRCS